MKTYIQLIYDEIIGKEDNDVLISKTPAWRIIILCVAKSLEQLWLSILCVFKKNPNIKDKHLAIAITANQMRSVGPLSLDGNTLFVVNTALDSFNCGAPKLYFSPIANFLQLFGHLRYFKRQKISWKNYYTPIAYFYYYKGFLRLFYKNRPNSVTITNPSHPILRSAILAARELGIPTVYLPHASTSSLYPTITTDYALLEGTDALITYKFADYTQKMLVGSPRLDPYKEMKPEPHTGVNVLIAVNLLDDIAKVLRLCELIQKNTPEKPYHLLLRPHPNLTIQQDDFERIGVNVISAKEESCMQSLQKADILISANSTIFFEAIYLPIKCFYYDFVQDCFIKDSYNLSSYSFVRYIDDKSLNMLSCNYIEYSQEYDRIDVTINTKKSAKQEITSFYNALS